MGWRGSSSSSSRGVRCCCLSRPQEVQKRAAITIIDALAVRACHSKRPLRVIEHHGIRVRSGRNMRYGSKSFGGGGKEGIAAVDAQHVALEEARRCSVSVCTFVPVKQVN